MQTSVVDKLSSLPVIEEEKEGGELQITESIDYA